MVVLFVRLETVALTVMIHRKGILFSTTLYAGIKFERTVEISINTC